MRKLYFAAINGLLVMMIGCTGSPSFAPVSGVVTLDGKPYDKAVVSFQPIGTKENPNPGRGSSAYTDANGRFELKCDDGNNGAVIGKHLIRIMTKGNDVSQIDLTKGSSDEGAKPNIDPIPPEWNSVSKHEFEVPAGGTDKANFDIISVKKGGASKK